MGNNNSVPAASAAGEKRESFGSKLPPAAPSVPASASASASDSASDPLGKEQQKQYQQQKQQQQQQQRPLSPAQKEGSSQPKQQQSESIYAFQLSDGAKLWVKKNRTPIATGIASVSSTLLAVCYINHIPPTKLPSC